MWVNNSILRVEYKINRYKLKFKKNKCLSLNLDNIKWLNQKAISKLLYKLMTIESNSDNYQIFIYYFNL